MGGGTYSATASVTRRTSIGAYDLPVGEVLKNRRIQNAMDPKGITVRESRDSDEHPNSLPIIIGLDVTASMGAVPQMLVRDGLPNIMGKVIQNGELDPQVMFLGIGDHECDQSPLQVGQFESNDKDLDKWLMEIYLEGGGGGNQGESYILAWYFAHLYTSIDSWDKRQRKGLIFTIGDEPPLMDLPERAQRTIMGEGQYSPWTANSLLNAVLARYDVYHIHVLETASGRRYQADPRWRELMGTNLIEAQSAAEVADIIVDTVAQHGGAPQGVPAVEPTDETPIHAPTGDDSEIVL